METKTACVQSTNVCHVFLYMPAKSVNEGNLNLLPATIFPQNTKPLVSKGHISPLKQLCSKLFFTK